MTRKSGFLPRGARRVITFAATAAVMACGGDAAAPVEDVDALEMAVLLLGGPGHMSVIGTSASGVTPAGTLPCAAGGAVHRSGSWATEDDAGALLLTWDTQLEHAACAHTTRGGIVVSEGTIVSRGSSRVLPATEPGVAPELLAYESTESGELTFTRAGQATTCVLDLSHGFDPANGRSIDGTMCGRPVHLRLHAWQPPAAGH